MTTRAIALLAAVLFVAPFANAGAEKPVILQKPAVSRTHVVFTYGGDLWIVGRDGGEATRLTTGAGTETDPIFSPDGTQIAFTGEYDGNTDVYVVPAAGGVPRRLTYHPGPDIAVGWSPDGKKVLFRSGRNSYSRFNRLFTVPAEGAFPTEVPLPMAQEAAYSPDGSQLAYVPFGRAFQVWKGYRGGRTTPIWIARLSDSRVEKVPRNNSNDFNPMWVSDRVYFLSDRDGPVSLYSYDPAAKKVSLVVRADRDIRSASAGPDTIVYEQLGSVHLLDLKSGKSHRVNIQVAGDLLSVRPRFEKAASRLRNASLSPSGVRALFEARGEVFSVPAEKGDVRNLTNTPGIAERSPAWSPDGKRIACFSDESGEYELQIRDQSGMGEVKKIAAGDPPSFYYSPRWSPDSKKIAYTDKRLNVWYLDVESGKSKRVDTDTYEVPQRALDPAWSPDSRWLAYTKQLKNHLRAVFVYSIERGESDQVTDGMSDARYAAFDKNGKYLYFTASTDAGPTTGWLDMSSLNRPVTRNVYVVVLGKDLPSPLAPESDEEKAEAGKAGEKPAEKDKADEKPAEKDKAGEKPAEKAGEKPTEKSKDAEKGKEGKEKEPVKVTIDMENIGQRILALPIPARNYVGLWAGKSGILFLAEQTPVPVPGVSGATIHKFDLSTRKIDKFLERVGDFEVSFNGEKALYRQEQRWAIAGTAQAPKSGEGMLKTDQMEVRVDPPAEWRQMYREVWRIERDFFYDPGFHGLDLKAAEKRYEPYLERLGSRGELNDLFAESLGEFRVGHLYIFGGDMPEVKRVRGGLLGADYTVENGRYRFARVYSGENWNPDLRAPLTQPGVNVVAGEYLLAVNGRELRVSDNLYSFFEATAGTSVVIKVGRDPSGAGAREVTVVPVESETALRNLAWIEENRRKVDQMTGGRVAYVYLPNTGGAGYTNFNRYYFAQVGKEAAVIDERFNGGGLAADYIIDYMRRPLLNYWTTREGTDFTTPLGSIFGPKVMIINEHAGSGGDAMPWYFRKSGIGPLIGTRTWGGLVGIYDYPVLIDGGSVTAPRMAFWSPKGDWDVENHGVAPDIEVEMDPQAARAGHDPQLEKAVQVVMDALKKNPLPKHHKPAYPNHYKTATRAAGAP